MNVIEFTNDMNREDYRELMYFNLMHRKKIFRYLMMLMVVFCAAIVVCGIINVIAKDYFFYMSLLTLFLVVMLYIQIEGMAKKFDKNVSFKAGYCRPFTIDDEGIKSPMPDETLGCVKWESITEAYETQLHYLFYVGPRNALTMVKRAMNAEQVDALRKMAGEKLGKKFQQRLQVR